MTATLKEPRTHGYGLVLRRRLGDCLVMDGPSRVHFLHGECECLIVHQGDIDTLPIIGRSIDLQSAALIYWIRGSGRVGIQAPRTTRALRGELLGGAFAEQPLVAALAHRGTMPSDGPLTAITERKSVTHLQLSPEGLTWRH